MKPLYFEAHLIAIPVLFNFFAHFLKVSNRSNPLRFETPLMSMSRARLVARAQRCYCLVSSTVKLALLLEPQGVLVKLETWNKVSDYQCLVNE